jgi:hypothetical protein
MGAGPGTYAPVLLGATTHASAAEPGSGVTE